MGRETEHGIPVREAQKGANKALHDFGFILGLCLSFCREGVAVPAARNGNGSTGLWWRRVVVKVKNY